MGDEIFSVYLTPADYSKLAYAKLDLPASPWKLLDAMDKVRLPEGDSLYLEITDYRDFEVLRSSLVCSATNLLELNDLAERLSRLNEVQRIAFEGLVRVDFQKQESITLKRLRDLTESVDCCHVVESVVSDGQLGPDGQYSKADIPEHTQYDTQSLAKFAFSMFWRAMRFAEEQQVPILLDY